MTGVTGPIELGHGHVAHPFGWHPDRSHSPQYADLADVDLYGLIIDHQGPDGVSHCSPIVFDSPAARRLSGEGRDLWILVSADPLTVHPSVLCSCGDNGFILAGSWLPC